MINFINNNINELFFINANSSFNFISTSVVVVNFENHAISYPAPLVLGMSWSFGFIILCFLILQLISGLFLSFFYITSDNESFFTIHTVLLNDIKWGYWAFYAHGVGASMLFIFMYLHIIRGVLTTAHLSPHVWISGVILFLLMMATAFSGYVLPWRQMSFWALTVITNFATAIPGIGLTIAKWLWGGEAVGSATLTSFFILHFILALSILIILGCHILFLHVDGSSTNDSHWIENSLWWSFYSWNDIAAVYISLFIMIFIITYYPDFFSHPDNWELSDPTVTPKHIVPEWYFLPFYGIVNSIPHNTTGILLMLLSIVVWVIFPFIGYNFDPSIANSRTYFWVDSVAYFTVLVTLIILGLVGEAALTHWVYVTGLHLVMVYFYAIAALIILRWFS